MSRVTEDVKWSPFLGYTTLTDNTVTTKHLIEHQQSTPQCLFQVKNSSSVLNTEEKIYPERVHVYKNWIHFAEELLGKGLNW